MGTPRDVDAYLAALDPARRAAGAALRAAIRAAAPDAAEHISYALPTYRLDGRTFLYFGVWRRHLSLHPIRRAPAALEARLAPLRHGRDTVRLPLDAPLDLELVAAVVALQRSAPSDEPAS